MKGAIYYEKVKSFITRNLGGGAFLELFLSKEFFQQWSNLLILFFVNCIDKCELICHNGNIINKRETIVMKKLLAFTLAEVLVTLGIIGVVSAMTVPSLMQNHQRKTYVTQLHQVYNLFQQAFLQYTNDKNALNLHEAGLISSAEVSNFMNSYFKIVQSCTDFTECFYDGSYKNMSGTDLTNASYWPGASAAPCFVLANGASVCVENSKYHTTYGHITIDINGKKGPNKWGYDLFNFRLQGLSSKPVYLAPHPVSIYEQGGKPTKEMVKSMGN